MEQLEKDEWYFVRQEGAEQGDRVKGKILKTVVQPAMLFSIGTVPLSKRQESKLEVVDMRMSRWMLSLSREDRVRNEEIRKRLGTTEMGKWCRQARLEMVWSC